MNKKSHPALIVCLLATVACLPVQCRAADANASVGSEQMQETPQTRFIQDIGSRAIKIITNKQLSADQRNAEFSKVLTEAFDLKAIARFVIGRAWNTATPEQQNEYMALFKALLIKNYGNRMTLATGENFRVVGSRPESDTDTTVISQVTHPDGSAPTEIDWRVRQKDGQTGVLDVIVLGVSLSVTQRQEYTAIIQSNGGQLDGLLEAMRRQLQPKE